MATLSASGKAYLENFQNPYVKIIIVCKICSKEQNLKRSDDWKRHYLTHAKDSEKPHKCHLCSKAFVAASQLSKHIHTHQKACLKLEN